MTDKTNNKTTIKIDEPTLKGEIDVTPRETTYIKTSEGEADILSNPQHPLKDGEIYTQEEAEAVRLGKLSVEDVVKAHEDEVFDGIEIVSKKAITVDLSGDASKNEKATDKNEKVSDKTQKSK